jgi:hypothetical protein
MRSPQYFLSLLFVLVPMTHAQAPTKTDAQIDDLTGPVKSVSTKSERSNVNWQPPGGPTLLIQIRCRDCEYDRDGSKTKDGQVVDGAFVGQLAQLVRGADGKVTERLVLNATTGQMDRHEVIGPFGKTKETSYVNGKVLGRQTYEYDQNAYLIDWHTFDSLGNQEERVFWKRGPDGTLMENSVWDQSGQLSYQQTFDAETKVEHFTTFDQFGHVKLTWTVIAGKLFSYWQTPDSPSQFGDSFSEDSGNGDVENYACHSNGGCDISRVHYDYLDSTKRNPSSAEWRDSDGNLRFAVYYDYGIDSFRNWTHRRVWVWSLDLGKRQLYETDSRDITYWQK